MTNEKTEQIKTDAEILWEFFRKLSPRAIIRHHIAGDFGKNG